MLFPIRSLFFFFFSPSYNVVVTYFVTQLFDIAISICNFFPCSQHSASYNIILQITLKLGVPKQLQVIPIWYPLLILPLKGYLQPTLNSIAYFIIYIATYFVHNQCNKIIYSPKFIITPIYCFATPLFWDIHIIISQLVLPQISVS